MGIIDWFKQEEEVPELEVYDKSLQPYVDDLVVTIMAASTDGSVNKKKEQSVIMSKHHALRRAVMDLETSKKI
tara:strand:+ start:2661 stop:2879 length:219 start_codon:yes stop_codon:yes gene_type:complete